jgi:hypothetical protein
VVVELGRLLAEALRHLLGGSLLGAELLEDADAQGVGEDLHLLQIGEGEGARLRRPSPGRGLLLWHRRFLCGSSHLKNAGDSSTWRDHPYYSNYLE